MSLLLLGSLSEYTCLLDGVGGGYHKRMMNKNFSYIFLVFTLLIAAFSLAACDTAAPAVQATPTREATATSMPTLTATQTVTPTPTSTPTPDTGPKYIGTLGEGMMSDIFRSPDGKIIAVGIDDDLHWFDSETFEEIGNLPLGISVTSPIEFSSDSRFVCVHSNSNGGAKVVDLDRKEVVSTLRVEHRWLDDFKFTPDNRHIVFTGFGEIHWSDILGLWDVEKDELDFLYDMPDPEEIHRIAEPDISADGTMVAAGCSEEVNIWELHSGELLFSFDDHVEGVPNVDFSPDGKLLASGSGQIVFLWDPVTGKKVDAISYWKGDTPSVRFSSDGLALNIENRYGPDYTWNLNDRKLSQLTIQPTPDPFGVEMHYRGYSQDVSHSGVFFDTDGRHLAVSSEPILVFDIENQNVITSFEGSGRDYPADLQYSPNGQWLAADCDCWEFYVWNVENEKVQIQRISGILTGESTPGSMYSFSFSPDSSLIAVGGENTIEIWDIEEARLLFVLHVAHESRAVWEVAFSSDGKRLYTILNTGDKRIAETWDLVNRQLVHRFDLPDDSPGNRGTIYGPYYAHGYSRYGEESRVEIWNLETAEIELILEPSTGVVEFSSDGNYLITYEKDDLYLWDVTTGELVFMISNLPEIFGSIVISPDNQMLAFEREGKVDLFDISQVIIQRNNKYDWEERTPLD
jgi:WD40 repeat protein